MDRAINITPEQAALKARDQFDALRFSAVPSVKTRFLA